MSTLSEEQSRTLPIFKVWADGGKYPPVALDKPVCVIGRREVGVNLPLHAPQVSKLHALVVRTQRKVYLRDLASRNGVHRNGEPVQEVGLSDEDVIRIGNYTLRCSSGFGHATEPSPDETGAAAAAVAEPLPAAELVATNGVTYPFPSNHQTLLIGHREGCEVRLDDELVAPVHAILFEMDGKRYVRDLGAPVGTHLNDRSIHQAELTPGDQLRVGNVTFTYALVDPMRESLPSLDAIGISDSLIAPTVDLGDSAVNRGDSMAGPNVATADSMIVPEITMEDSRAPAADAPARPAAPISEYDMDVVEPDPRRESTFHGEVIADTPRPERPETPPTVAGGDAPVPVDAPEAGHDDSAVPIAGSFHDQILEDHLLQDLEDPHAQSRGPLPMGDDVAHDSAAAPKDGEEPPAPEPQTQPAPPEAPKAAEPEAAEPEAASVAAEVAEAEASANTPPVTAKSDPREEVITQLVENVGEQVAQVSEKVELVAAKVERVAAKMGEVTKDVSDAAGTAATLQEVWTEFRGGAPKNYPGASENAAPADKSKSSPEQNLPVKPPQSAAQKPGEP